MISPFPLEPNIAMRENVCVHSVAVHAELHTAAFEHAQLAEPSHVPPGGKMLEMFETSRHGELCWKQPVRERFEL